MQMPKLVNPKLFLVRMFQLALVLLMMLALLMMIASYFKPTAANDMVYGLITVGVGATGLWVAEGLLKSYNYWRPRPISDDRPARQLRAVR